MFGNQILTYRKEDAIYNVEDIHEFGVYLNELRLLIINQYEDLSTGLPEEISQIFESGTEVYIRFEYLVKEENNVPHIKNARKKYTLKELTAALDDLSHLINNFMSNDYQSTIKSELWYTTGIKGVTDGKSGFELFNKILAKATYIKTTLNPISASPATTESGTIAGSYQSPIMRFLTPGSTGETTPLEQDRYARSPSAPTKTLRN